MFVRNHVEAIVACDLFVAVSARFRVLYVFAVMEAGSRRVLHVDVTDHPTVLWTAHPFEGLDRSFRGGILGHVDREAAVKASKTLKML